MRLPAGSVTPTPRHLPESHISPTSSPPASSAAFASATSRDAQRDGGGRQGRELVVVRVGSHDGERAVAELVLDPVLVG